MYNLSLILFLWAIISFTNCKLQSLYKITLLSLVYLFLYSLITITFFNVYYDIYTSQINQIVDYIVTQISATLENSSSPKSEEKNTQTDSLESKNDDTQDDFFVGVCSGILVASLYGFGFILIENEFLRNRLLVWAQEIAEPVVNFGHDFFVLVGFMEFRFLELGGVVNVAGFLIQAIDWDSILETLVRSVEIHRSFRLNNPYTIAFHRYSNAQVHTQRILLKRVFEDAELLYIELEIEKLERFDRLEHYDYLYEKYDDYGDEYDEIMLFRYEMWKHTEELKKNQNS